MAATLLDFTVSCSGTRTRVRAMRAADQPLWRKNLGRTLAVADYDSPVKTQVVFTPTRLYVDSPYASARCTFSGVPGSDPAIIPLRYATEALYRQDVPLHHCAAGADLGGFEVLGAIVGGEAAAVARRISDSMTTAGALANIDGAAVAAMVDRLRREERPVWWPRPAIEVSLSSGVLSVRDPDTNRTGRFEVDYSGSTVVSPLLDAYTLRQGLHPGTVRLRVCADRVHLDHSQCRRTFRACR